MKKMLILDVAHSYGHKKFNYYYLNLISQHCSLMLINDGSYYNELKCENIVLLDFHKHIPDRGSILNRINIIKTFKKIAKQRILDSVDAVLVMGYDTLSFPFFYFLCRPKVKVYTIQHHNIDENKNIIKRYAFNIYKNRMTHIVLDNSFVDMVRKKIGIKSDIEYLPHYLSKYGFCNQCSSENNIIALSNSNDEEKIAHLIDIDKKGMLNCISSKIIVKSNIYQYESDRLRVLKGYISDEMYRSLFINAKATLILFPSDYDIRFSCTLIEAIINYKMVIGYSIPFVHEYAMRYPNSVSEYIGDDELLELLKTLNDRMFDNRERKKLIDELSVNQIDMALNRIFNNYKF